MLKGRVLLLNADSSILGTIGVARAIRMTLREENPVTVQEYVTTEDGSDFVYLTSGSGDKYPVPSVLMLNERIDVRKKRQESGAKRMKIYLRDKYQCQYCSIKIGQYFTDKKGVYRKHEVKDLTLDHVLPKSRGGEGTPGNLVASCKACNQRKDNRTPEEARMPLRTQIHDIKDIGLDKIMICKYLEHRPEWLFWIQDQEGYKEIIEDMGFAKAA